MSLVFDTPVMLERFDVVGTRVGAVSPSRLGDLVLRWVGDGKVHYVCFADVNSLIAGRDNPAMRAALDAADVVSPDGKPLALVGRHLRGADVEKTSGPDFLESFCRDTARRGVRHFFLGGMPGVAQSLAERLVARYPGLVVAGTYSPAKFPLTAEQNDDMIAAIIAARPDVVWVGLGAPRQEIWMHENRHRLANLTLFGVGAAFDFSAGRVKRAPLWMQRTGLEWLYRITQEPKRLFGRYARVVPRFIGLVLMERLGLRIR